MDGLVSQHKFMLENLTVGLGIPMKIYIVQLLIVSVLLNSFQVRDGSSEKVTHSIPLRTANAVASEVLGLNFG
jgi:hypothetical protein